MQIACLSCKKQLKVPDTAVGKKVKCPACGTIFTALDQVEEMVEPGPPPPKPKRKPDVVEEAPPPRPRRSRDDDEDDDRPRRSRPRDEDDDRPQRSRNRDDDDDRPRRSRRRDEYDDDDQFDDYKTDRKEARRRGQAAAFWFLLAGIISLVMITLSIISNFVISASMPAPGNFKGANVGAYQAGRIVGILSCGVVGVIGAISHFLACSSLKSFKSKSSVVTAIVFGFIFGILFGIGVIINIISLIAISQLPVGLALLKVLIIAAIILGATTSFFNMFAAIKGITTLGNRAIKRQFDRRGR